MEIWLVLTFQIGLASDALKAQGAQLVLPVVFLHAASFALGYWVSRISFGESSSRTVSIECGMQVNLFIIPQCLIVLLNCFPRLSTFLTSEKIVNHSTFPDSCCFCWLCINSSGIGILAYRNAFIHSVYKWVGKWFCSWYNLIM